MKPIKTLIFISLIAFAWISCDVVEPPVYGCMDPLASNFSSSNTLPDGPCQGNCDYDATAVLGCTDVTALNYNPLATSDNCDCIFEGARNILIEDYTGHTCANCPVAAEALHELEVTYGARIVPIAVHVSQSFASPQNNPDGSYSYDFRTPEGNIYDDEFRISFFGLPGGMVNRKSSNEIYSLPAGNWAQEAEMLLDLPPEALIGITHTYDSITRVVEAVFEINALVDLPNNPYRLSVVLTEDSVINWQKDNRLTDPDIPDYVHMHVLRASFNGAWGTSVGGGDALTAGQTENVSLSLTMDEEYVDHNCNIVAFIYRDDTKQVIQADYTHVIEK